MKKKVVVLGGNKLHKGFTYVKEKLQLGEIIVIDWNENPDFIGDKHYQLDIKDFESIAKQDIPWEEVAFVYTSADVAVNTQVQLHKYMGLLVPKNEAIENALIKGKSRDCWEKAGILNKYSVVIGNASEFVPNGSKKYIFKPNCSSGSRNITILREEELTSDAVIKAVESAKSVSIDNACIVEEFVEGIEYTVDMLGDSYGNVGVFGISKKYHTPYNTENKIATKLHYSPSDVDKETLDKIAAFGQQCYRAIGLSNSFGHLEIIMSNDGRIVPVEIGARSSGYIATHLIDLINNLCYLEEYSEVLRGKTVSDGLIFDMSKSSMYYFYDVKPGISVCNTNIMEYLPNDIKSYASDRSGIVEKRYYPVINADHERYGFEILGGTCEHLTIDVINNAEKCFNERFIG